jgi:hypothetical protein
LKDRNNVPLAVDDGFTTVKRTNAKIETSSTSSQSH